MKKTLQLLRGGFESSSHETPEFNEFFKVFVSEFKRELKKYYKVKDFHLSKGHFYISGFFRLEDDRIFYVSTWDVRYFQFSDISNTGVNFLLIRTAKSFTDFHGGSNNYIKMAKDMFKNYQLPK